MRAFLAIAVIAALSTGAALAGSPTQERSSSKATLTLVRSTPPTVSGTHFRAKERVKVTFHAGTTTQARRVRANATGSFSAAMSTDVQSDRCGDLLLVRALGDSGDHASVKLQLPACPPAP